MQEILNVKMDANSIEEQRRKIEEKSTVTNSNKYEFNAKNYLNLSLENGQKERKVRIRILNATPESSTPFLILKTHNLKVAKDLKKSGKPFKSYFCLNDASINNGEKCPICELSQEYFRQANGCADESEKKKLLKTAYSFKPKNTYVLRVIDREHEDEGVKFWKFNEHTNGDGCYDMLMSIYDERKREHMEVGLGEYNIFDLNNGKDIIITIKKAQNSDNNELTLIDAGVETPLSLDPNKAMAWINDTKKWSDVYSVKNREYLSIVLDGKVPVRDNSTGRYNSVESKFNSNNIDNNVENNAQSILNPYTESNGYNNTTDTDFSY